MFIMNDLNQFIPINTLILFGNIEYWMWISDQALPNIISGRYLISTHGRIFSILTNQFLKPQVDKGNYFRISLYTQDGKLVTKIVHRLLMITFFPIYNFENLEVNHIDGNKQNNHILNLEWCTASENIKHAYDNGLKKIISGEDRIYATITNEQADRIGYLLSLNQYSHKEISIIIGCDISVINNISSGTNWKPIYDKYNLSDIKHSKPNLRSLTDEQVNNLCTFFSFNKLNDYKNKTEYFKQAFIFMNGDESLFNNSYLRIINDIYKRKSYRNISKNYNF